MPGRRNLFQIPCFLPLTRGHKCNGNSNSNSSNSQNKAWTNINHCYRIGRPSNKPSLDLFQSSVSIAKRLVTKLTYRDSQWWQVAVPSGSAGSLQQKRRGFAWHLAHQDRQYSACTKPTLAPTPGPSKPSCDLHTMSSLLASAIGRLNFFLYLS